MNRFKNLSVPLVSAVIASATLHADAQVSMSLSSDKSYRQNKKDVRFLGGSFDISFGDGSVIYFSDCSYGWYQPPGILKGICAGGTTGLITGVGLNQDPVDYPYILVNSLQAASVVEPRRPDLVFLKAAPASRLPRPLGGFQDNSLSLFFNLHTDTVSEYLLTGYSMELRYNKNQRKKFEDEIVPGAYYYSFPRLGRSNLSAALAPVIYPMAEGRNERNNKVDGFEFTQVNKKSLKWVKTGFVEIGANQPTTIHWRGLSPSTVFPSTDSLYIALRPMQNPKNPKSATGTSRDSIFPPYENGRDPRVVLRNPFVDSYTLPPIFRPGTRAIVEISLQRNFKTGGVTYDYSSRKFQMPVIFVDRYTDYANLFFKKGKVPKILADTDKDGFNNLTEWILGSNANSRTSVPQELIPAPLLPIVDTFFGRLGTTNFGFDVERKLETVPRVNYILQRSTNGGRTWNKFTTDGDWSVEFLRYVDNGNTYVDIQVRSLVESTPRVSPPRFVQPPGTEGHLYRVKVVLPKKKK